MASHCDNCGERVYNGACVNCHEEVYIQEQYIDLDMEVPDSINKKVGDFAQEIEENLKK